MPEELEAVSLDSRPTGPSRLYGATWQVPDPDNVTERTQQVSCRVKLPQEQLEAETTHHTSGIELLDDETGQWSDLVTAEDRGNGPRFDKHGEPIDWMGGAGINVENLVGRTLRPFIDLPVDGLDISLELWTQGIEG
jgi:hypothetical protein